MTSELHNLSIAEASRLIGARKLSPVELTDALLNRITALDVQLNAFISITADLATWHARQAEEDIGKGRYRGPLHGVPFALKDIYNTKARSRPADRRSASPISPKRTPRRRRS